MPAEAASLARLYAKVLEPRRASSTFERVLAKFRGVHLRRPPRLEARLQHSCSTVVAEQAYCAYCGPNTGLYVRRHLLTCKAVGLSEVFHQHDIRNPDFVLNIQNGLFIGRY